MVLNHRITTYIFLFTFIPFITISCVIPIICFTFISYHHHIRHCLVLCLRDEHKTYYRDYAWDGNKCMNNKWNIYVVIIMFMNWLIQYHFFWFVHLLLNRPSKNSNITDRRTLSLRAKQYTIIIFNSNTNLFLRHYHILTEQILNTTKNPNNIGLMNINTTSTLSMFYLCALIITLNDI